ncbi:DEAD/DEAH box helicase [Alkalispirochaeta sphaeroplastigenens]|uniref:Type I restriction enzyme endonuclease subunit n=1 Tax=Alkalispirochaeta sphaeroplastigenens TaxID=1187066 RepID=A0A2S4JFM7_9SPIO|nr:type I restriction endonuclease subunit R [Alkalispirochaeta sphaeroplastigenens]POQ98323.1 DEAD/DEAH box helicase [Alkalispirochaeta sphaeroplastigenens]
MTLYNEDTLVQQTTAEYLEQELGWESVYAYNTEDFGPDSLLGRESDRDVVLTRTLRTKIEELNPGLPATAYADALRQIVTVSASQTMAVTNREKYELVKDGVPVTFRNAKGERIRQRLRVFDFDVPENNHFLCVRELWVRGDLYRRRADIVGFINGLPLLFMELKNVSKDIRAAYEQNFLDYRDTIPHLFHHNAMVVLANGVDAKLGSLTSRFEHFHEWKRLAENQPGAVAMETLLKGVCAKANFLDLVENFIVFDDSAGESRKILARNHQYLGVNQAIEAVRDRKLRSGKLGVFWHTQGSGKSYSMVLFTRKVHRKLGGNFTFLILTDRDDLDAQIYKTFAGCGVVDNDRDPCRAASGEHLGQLLAQHKSHIFSLIQKFNQTVSEGESYSRRDDLIVITDEAHRTQYGTLALNMRNALPNASYIGFTGTPLFKNDEITRRVFGDYVSTYDFQRAVEDKATVPLYYDARGDKLGLAVNDLNERIAEKLEEIETSDIDVDQRLEQALKRDYHIITAGKRLDQVARDFVQHYSTAWETGKAMLVCIDKITCVRMHKLVEFYWNEKIGELKAQLPNATDEQDEQYRRRQIDWMLQTKMAVVVSEEQGEVEKFRKWELDITPHRRLIKEGIDLPETMRSQPQFQNMQRLSLEDAFKAKEHPLRVAIVCAMWLTGFDVPNLSTLYLDKPLKAHTLMQAIARANRVSEGKNNGMIVDYCGILKNLRRALATFAGTGDDGRGCEGGETEPAKPDEELLADLHEAIAFVRSFLVERSASLDEIIGQTGFARNAAILSAKEAANENDETRKRFEVMCRAVFSKFKACLTIEGVNACRDDYDAINIVYKSLQQDREKADITDIIRELHQVVDEAIETQMEPGVAAEAAPYDISKIDFDRLRREFERSSGKRTTVQNLKTIIELRLQRLLLQNPLRTDFQKHYEEIVAEYNREKDRVTIEKTFEALLQILDDMNDEETRAVREGLNEESLAVFDLLRKPDMTSGDIKRIKAVAVDLLETLKAEKLRINHWRDKESTRDAVRLTIQDYLWNEQTGLPEIYSVDDVRDKTEAVFLHVFRAYPTVPSPYYEMQAV